MRGASILVAISLGGCAAPPPPEIAPCPPPPDVATADIHPSKDVLAAGAEALVAADHVCATSPSDPGVQLCDQGRSGYAAFALAYQGPRLFMVSHFARKEGVSCEQTVGVINALNVKADALKIVCDEARITFVSDVYVGQVGIAAEALQEEVRRFQGVIQLALREATLRSMLR